MFRKISPWVVMFSLLLSSAAMSLGLGELKLHSNLNQPLNAEIKLLSADTLTKSQILVNLASQDDFRNAGVEHFFFLRKIKFLPIFNDDGSVIIKLSTKNPIKEPYLDFLIEVNWPNGRIMREYTLLLDPPTFSEVAIGSAPEMANSSNNQYQPEQVDTNTLSKDRWTGDESEKVTTTDGDYQVEDADTLWGIARKNRIDTASIQQTMVSIFNNNPSAFTNNNMNELKRGSVLTLDSQNLLSQQQALLEIARQNQEWGGTGSAGTRPDVVVDTADYDYDNNEPSSSEPRLKLSAVGDGSVNGSSGALESEAVTTLIDENESLRTRLDDQSDRIEKLERLLELKNNELAVIGTDEATLVEDASEDDSEVVSDYAEETILNDSGAEDEQIKSEIADSEKLDDNEAAATTEEETTEQIAEIKDTVSQAATAPAPVKEESFFDSILNLGSMLWMAIISGILVLFFLFLWVRRQGMVNEDFQDSLVIPGVSDFDEDDIPEVADDLLASEMVTETDFIPESDIEELNSDEVDMETNADPLGEADVYLAYGKFDQAERILRDALEEEPERTDLRLKLMECFAETKSLGDFKDQKREILETLATDETIAEQVNIMERQAWPEEAEEGDDIPSTEDIFGDLSFGGDSIEDSDELVFPDEDEEIDIDIEENFENGSDLDFSAVDSDDDTSGSLSTDEFIDEELEMDDDIADMNFISTPPEAKETEEGVDFISESELLDSEINDDVLEELDEEPVDEMLLDLGDVDEASTKLDLARAYVDMEDFEGATEILEEVINEGSDSQKAEAEELLERIK